MALLQARRHGEHAARLGDVLTEEDDGLVPVELLVERVADRRAELDRGGGRCGGQSSSSRSHQKAHGLLEPSADVGQERGSVGPVKDAVIRAQRQ